MQCTKHLSDALTVRLYVCCAQQGCARSAIEYRQNLRLHKCKVVTLGTHVPLPSWPPNKKSCMNTNSSSGRNRNGYDILSWCIPNSWMQVKDGTSSKQLPNDDRNCSSSDASNSTSSCSDGSSSGNTCASDSSASSCITGTSVSRARLLV
eukprot:20579-Heterococcus_DN1.PRE.1